MSITLHQLLKQAQAGEKIAMLTCYDASFAQLMDDAGVDMLLVGDSLGMVIQGHGSTLPVHLDDMIYHTKACARGAKNAFIVADLPFGDYQASPEQAFHASAKLMSAGAHMVKLEGGAFMAKTVKFLVERGIPVCAHIGFTPQAVNLLGLRVQGRGDDAQRLRDDAQALAQAGAAMVLMEMVPADLARDITEHLAQNFGTPTIGIGAGKDCSGQVLVTYDILGLYPGRKPRFSKDFLAENASIPAAIKAYVQAVKAQTFPSAEHSF